ncbi:MAG: preprotein translocase subunit SecG [Candidatus Bathyarchaeota archaeon]|nr:preprotein translocase subunit SecG [Candidatus Bathyarchaeota archaeon]
MGIINILQIIVSVLLIISILLQKRGAGLSSAFGGEGGYYFKKRGAEKIIFWSTVVLSFMFIGLAFLSFLI